MRHETAALTSLALCIVLVGVSFGQTERSTELKAGVARVELRPPLGFGMAGFGARKGNSEGVLDPLQAKVLVLEGKRRAVAFVTMDLAAVFPDAQLDEIRSRVKASAGIEDVIVSCSHTHSGPNVEMEDPPEWQKGAAADIGAAIEQAWKTRVPARLGIGQGSCYIGHNRLHMMSEGSGKMIWRNETRIRTSPVDPTVMILRLDRNDGSPLAVLVNYGCHPVVLGPENLRYSADYPGEMMRAVESEMPNSSCMFLQAACGDINPYYDKTPIAENAVALMKETGRVLAREVLRVARSIQTKAAPDAEIQISREVLQFKPRWNKAKVLARLSGAPLTPYMKRRIDRMLKDTYPTPLTTVLFNRDFAFVGVPAEIFVDYQLELRERVSDFPVLFGGYTNGNVAYVPTIKGAVDGGYGASEMGALIEIGAGDRLIDKAVIQLGYWTGKLKSVPETPTN